MSDGEHTTPELDFAILLLSNHQQPPVFQVLDPLLEVTMGGQAVIGERGRDTNTPQEEAGPGGSKLFVYPASHYASCLCVCVCACV